MKLFVVFFLFWSLAVFGQHKLSISIEGVPSSEGDINIAIYNQSNGFLDFENAYKADSTKAKHGTTELTIEDLPEGTYAIAIFHDKNGNKRLDTNWLGIPKEQVAFSKAKMRAFGPPFFEDCAFKIQGDGSLKIAF